MAKGVAFEGVNLRLGPPEGVTEEQCATIYAFDNGACTTTAWEVTPEELAEINRTGRIFLSVWGRKFPPVFVGSESTTHGVVIDFGGAWKLSEQPKQDNEFEYYVDADKINVMRCPKGSKFLGDHEIVARCATGDAGGMKVALQICEMLNRYPPTNRS